MSGVFNADRSYAVTSLDSPRIGIVFSLLTALFYFSLYKYFPAHFAFLRRRSAYYLYGDEATPVFDFEMLLSKARSVIAWFKHTVGISTEGGEVTAESLKDVAKGVAQVISSTAAHALSSTASAVTETAKVEL